MATESQATGRPHAHDQPSGSFDDDNLSPTSDNIYGSSEQAPTEKSHNDGNEPGQQDHGKEKPAWSELKTKAGKERKRLPLACIACRRKKIRCSGEKPACKHCSKSRIPCVYKVTTRKAAPRTDYMAMLDKRLRRMEERVIKAIPAGETRDMTAIGRSQVKPPPPGQGKQPKAVQKKRSADEAFTSELNAWMGQAGNVTTADAFPLSREGKSLEGTGLLTEGAEFLPSVEIQEHLSEVFFDCVYGQSYLLLHKPSFMRKLKAGTIPPVLILAVCAVSARFSTHPQINSEPAFLRGENWANPAATIALSRHDEPNITILTVFLLLGLHEFGTCHGGRSWSFGGQALRMAYALQLHREVDSDPFGQNGKLSELSCTDREIRRRTMWASFLMDRYNSSGSQRPPIGNEKFIQIQLPVKESHFLMEIPGPTEDLSGDVPNPVPEGQGQISDPKANMGVSGYIIRAIIIWGHIVDYLNLGGKRKDPYPLWDPNSGYNRLKKEIEVFSSSLPKYLVFNTENLQDHAAEKVANQFIFLHIIIHQNILFLNQFAIPLAPGGRPPKGMPKAFLSDAGRAAVEAAHHISTLIDKASGHSLTVPFAGYCAYSASTVHIWGIFSKNAQLEARSKENLRHTYRYLNQMKRYWGMFHYMVESAKDRYRQFADAALRGPLANVPSYSREQAPTMFQYGDWFDKYPHGVSRIHWEDPDTTTMSETGDDAVMGQRPDLQSVEDFFASLSPSNTIMGPRKLPKRSDNQQSSVHSLPQLTTDLSLQPQTLVDLTMSNAPAVMDSTGANYAGFNDPGLYRSPPQGFEPPTFDYGLPSDHIPQLDRHFVYGEYSGINPSTLASGDLSIHNTENPQQQPQPQDVSNESVWTDAFTPAGTGEFLQPSSWFLPFNLEPLGAGLGVGGDMTTGQIQSPGVNDMNGGAGGAATTDVNVMNPYNLAMGNRHGPS
ncbi:putative C6 transcription factor [Talaromyces proteolyticus]|uniref:C6 transcription factor n=1 Tax=Talaromyces proteolyticus TaxID=1131652 RepID=A0AAD4KHW7_9EURO|nr:putative C6 transcription factor [Talaromyces proteolyticus]KAH8692827.1 putative C6 transcription factor [Talaromyces proteolyticus]